MKKTITVTAALLLAAVFNLSFSRSSGDAHITGGLEKIRTLIINANVTVMLVDNDQVLPQVTGKNTLTQLVTFKQSGDTLIIGSLKDRDLVNAGTVYVPAAWLKNIRINSNATVRSLQTLQIPKLDVVINGSCYVQVSNIGEVNMVETEKYVFEQNREVRPLPANFVKGKKY
jgi:Putative auto-transporter adhesin, head GIN domain